jgi:hypothetical protein
MAKLYDTIGQKTESNLLADPQGAEKITVPLLPGQGELAIGTLLYRTADGFWAPAASGQINGSYQLAVLKETVDTGDDAAVAEDGICYRAGRFLNGKVILKAGGSLTEAHKIELRKQGIKFDPSTLDGEFDNGTYNITYVGNNSVPAEEDVVIPAMAGSTYTVLNNSDSKLGFTAPAGKTFSKWNTKADGTGTDYAAAATYSVTADLKLYAVWAS